MIAKLSVFVALSLALGTPAVAEFTKVTRAADFTGLVTGKTLTRPLVKLQLTADGVISGRGATWPVTGNWTWQNGFFCRSLEWGGDDLGYNCQEVQVSATKIRFTSDEGAGDSAEFNMR